MRVKVCASHALLQVVWIEASFASTAPSKKRTSSPHDVLNPHGFALEIRSHNDCPQDIAVVGVGGGFPLSGQEPEDGFVSLFDGRTLGGWVKRGGDAAYSVDNGTIVGECLPSRMNTFLCTEKEYGNFILKLEFKFDVPGNSGVQFRSAARPRGRRPTAGLRISGGDGSEPAGGHRPDLR